MKKKIRIILERARDGVEPLEDLEQELLNLHSVSDSLPTDEEIDNLTCEEMDEGGVYPPDYYHGFTKGAYWVKGKIISNEH